MYEFDLFYYLLPKNYRVVYDPLTGHMLISSFTAKSKGDDLRQRVDKEGYACVKLNNKTVKLHNIAAEIVLGPKPEGLVTNHIDGDKLNNTPWNLEYITPAENTKHAYAIGLHDSKLVPEEVKRQKKKDWYQKNRDKVIQKAKERYEKNPEKYKKYAKEYYKKQAHGS